MRVPARIGALPAPPVPLLLRLLLPLPLAAAAAAAAAAAIAAAIAAAAGTIKVSIEFRAGHLMKLMVWTPSKLYLIQEPTPSPEERHSSPEVPDVALSQGFDAVEELALQEGTLRARVSTTSPVERYREGYPHGAARHSTFLRAL